VREELVQRWHTEAGRWAREQVIRHLQKHKDLSKLTFLQCHEGRWDLRGMDFSRTPWHKFSVDVELTPGYRAPFTFALGGKYVFRRVAFRDADLSYANLGQARLEKCHFENVLFCHANYVGVGDPHSTFVQVDFFRADMRGATLGLEGARYEGCSFREADMRGVHGYDGYFVGCDFSNARLEEVDFEASHFIDCRFAGPLKKVWFRGYYSMPSLERRFRKTERNPMRNVDFSQATLWDVMFTNGCDLSTVVAPQDGEHFLFRHWPQVLARAEEQVARCWEGVFRDEALLWLRVLRRNTDQEMYIVNRRDFGHPEDLPTIREPASQRDFALRFVDLLLELEEQLAREGG